MKASKIIIPIFLSVALSILVVFIGLGYIDLDQIFGRGRSLEIDYLVDGKIIDDEENIDESLLAALRRRQKTQEEDLEEEIEVLDDEELDDDKLSAWEKMLLENQRRDSLKKKKDVKREKEVAEITEEESISNSFEEQILKSRERSKKQREELEAKKKKKDKGETISEEEKAYAEAKYEKELDEYKRKIRQKEKEEKKKERKKEEVQENIVTLSISCHTAVNKGMHKETEFRGIVPPSGVILSPVKLKMNEGDTVFDALIKAQNDYKFSLKYRGSGPRAYIESINRLEEFDGGKDSGWMYCVNGWYPDYGCGSYILKGGDVIEWNYTCEGLGADLGEKWIGN